MENKRKKKTVRLVTPTRKEPLTQRTVLELFSGSGSTQLVKASSPAGVEVETSAQELPSAWTSLLLEEKPLTNQKATVSATLSIGKTTPLKYRVRSLRIHQCFRMLVACLSGVAEKNMKENQKRKQQKRLLKG